MYPQSHLLNFLQHGKLQSFRISSEKKVTETFPCFTQSRLPILVVGSSDSENFRFPSV